MKYFTHIQTILSKIEMKMLTLKILNFSFSRTVIRKGTRVLELWNCISKEAVNITINSV
jgi:hypothetical protein